MPQAEPCTRPYAVWRIIPDRPGCVDFCGTVQACSLAEAEMSARLMYPVSGSEYLEIAEESRDDAPQIVGRDHGE